MIFSKYKDQININEDEIVKNNQKTFYTSTI